MYDLKWLRWVARDGLADLVPTVRDALTSEAPARRLHLVYGPSPRRMLLAIAVCGALIGELLTLFVPQVSFDGMVNPGAVLLGAAQAALIRRYLFRTEYARVDDFPWLAASVAPAVGVLILAQVWRGLLTLPSALSGAEILEATDTLMRLLADVLAVAAAYAVAVATLCYRRNWVRALWDLAVRLLVFRLTMWVMVLLLVEIGIVGPIVSAVIGSLTGWYPPDWIGDLADVITYALLMGVVLLAVIGAVWTVCRDHFAALLAEGEVDVLESLKTMSVSPQERAKREARDAKELEKREQREARKQRKAQRRRDGKQGDGTEHA